MKCLSIIRDNRIDATSVLMEMSTGDYLKLVSGAESNLDIQRKVVKGFKPYERLRDDLAVGCIIPPIVIGVKSENVKTPNNDNEESIAAFTMAIGELSPADVYIIDGLQRTRAIQDVSAKLSAQPDEHRLFLENTLRVEIWPDISLSALTYRMILLNAGQKPMSLKHQLEVVSAPLCKSLRETLGQEIDIYTEKDTARRAGNGQYQFSLIATSFQAFVQKKPHIDVRNDVIAELNQIDVLDKYGESIGGSSSKPDLTQAFEDYVRYLLVFDAALCRKYSESKDVDGVAVPTGVSLLARDTFHLGFSAAYGFCLEYYPEELVASKDKLIELLSSEAEDPLAIFRFEKIQSGFSRRDNTGEKTRDFIFKGFKEYFRSAGRISIEECWSQAS
ncbi:hypothetical protein ACM3N8_01680 [Aeromonas sp. A04]|uniref:hypothetical protein n=1 Tax=Aeromonas sp. A04 TaxID=3398359 RepID=UPI0039F69B5E